ncbi:glutathione S-transferase family protein [Mesorhizobium sp. PAMC28654]|uniref:glutathione S-transferase family protein n=1 Tax=Mesorhizobium sp. PAMC28654 TaxID=2880934 RepID=UPI001D0A16D0|nr:glutathione S-transferase family protein [Mesorhizobium sp. PAMC28654]UDL91359.1 glutathione S-transferase family protein [Mesorhizobium sp. PAMC28654]
MAEFTLYIGNKCFSSWSLRPWVAMKQLGIPFEEGFVRLRTPETAANLAAVSPTGQVPVLNHNGRIIWETLAILEYLADLFPDKKLWPADIGARALARSAATEMHSGFRELRYGWPMNLRRPRSHKPLDTEGEAQRVRIEALWRECREKHGKSGLFLFGHFTAADAMYAPVVTRFDTYGGTLAPDTRAYVDAMLATPAMQHWYEQAARETWPEPGPDE